MSEPFVPPHVDVSDDVLIFATPEDDRGQPAVVTKNNGRALNVVCNGTNVMYRGVHHRLDPQVKENPEVLRESRCVWDLSPKAKRIAALESKVEGHAKVIVELTKMFSADAPEKRGPGRPPKDRTNEGSGV